VSARSADMRYTGSMSNAFVRSMAHNFEPWVHGLT
jgi:hypothetical protein